MLWEYRKVYLALQYYESFEYYRFTIGYMKRCWENLEAGTGNWS